jgi:dynein heavy chain, axonemal
MVPADLTMPEKPRPKPVPYYGQVPIPPHDFPDALSNFNFSSLYIKEESIRAMVEIRGLCNDLMKKRIFDTAAKTQQRVDEFKMVQTGAISQFESDCGENGWVGNLARIIKTHFDDVGKGWFNIHEKSKSTYEFGKLKKFLTLVNFMMQDTILNICKDSIHEFVAFVLEQCPADTEIRNTHDVVNTFEKKLLTAEDSDFEELPYKDVPADELDDAQKSLQWVHGQFGKNKDPEPLFVVDLIVSPDSHIPRFTFPPDEIVKKVLGVFDGGVEKLGEIKQIETFLLGKTLFKGQHKFVKAPQRPQQEPGPPDPTKKVLPDENAWLWHDFKSLEAALEKAIKPLHDYLQTFDQF